MTFDDLFDQRNLVGAKLEDCLCNNGYTKVSFATKTGISRPTLDKLLNGTIENKTTFDKHLRKILSVLGMSVDEFIFSCHRHDDVEAVCSSNEPSGYQMSQKARKQYSLLLDILDLCEIYY